VKDRADGMRGANVRGRVGKVDIRVSGVGKGDGGGEGFTGNVG
jgi:hypothetical protein